MPAKPTTTPKYRRYSSEQRGAMLIEAGLACLARGGVLGFTIDQICREAGVSRGLITHHFKSKDGLLAAVYATMYDRTLQRISPESGEEPGIVDIIKAEFHADVFNRENITIWLALWGAIATNPVLRNEHRKHYGAYRDGIARALRRTAQAQGLTVDAERLSVTVISLIDGLWLEHCIDPELMTSKNAMDACYRMLEPFLGPLP